MGDRVTAQANTSEGAIVISQHPELASLCWNRHESCISPEDAYSLYVDHWAFVNKSALATEELALVRVLNARYGNFLRI